MTAETVFMRGQGGTIFEMDVPREGSAQWERAIEKIVAGELTEVAGDVVQVPNFDKSGYHWAEVDEPAGDTPKRGRGKGKADPVDEPAGDTPDA